MHLQGANIGEIPRFSPEISVLKLLIQAMEQNAKKVAQIEASTGKSYFFADLLQQSKSVATGLRKKGIAPDDYVVICCRKSSIAFAIQLGTMFAGAIPVLVNDKYASEIHKYTTQHVVKAIFCDKTNLKLVNQTITQMKSKPILIATTDINDPTMENLFQQSNQFSLHDVKDIRKKVVLVLFTSGTTSEPKGVQISDLGLQRYAFAFEDESMETYLITSSFSWISCTVSIVASILKGYSLVLSEANEPATHLKLVETYRINGWSIFSGDLNLYVKEPTLTSVDLSSLTSVNVGGAVVKRRSIETFISEVLKGKVGVQVLYGMTEIGIVTTWRNKNLLVHSKADSSGYLAPGAEVKITDKEGHLVEPGNIGEVRAKSVATMVGYWGRPELDAVLFDSDGFFSTGDAGYFDNEGFLYICGRASDIVTHGETKVSVSEIEDLLRTHPEVLNAGVVAKHTSLSDVQLHSLIAFLVVKPGCQVTRENLSEFLTDQAGCTVRLQAIQEVESIPRTQSGKVHRGTLLNMADKLNTSEIK